MTADYEALWDETWGCLQDVGPVHRHNRQIIVDLVRSLGVNSILDAGCGNGANLEAIQTQLGLTDVTGIDLSERALTIARRRVKGSFKVVDLEREQLDRMFDLVLTSQVIEHVVNDDGFLARLRSMCGRYVIVATVQGRMRKSEAHIGHVRNYTRSGLESQMRRAGFKIEKVVQWGFPFYSPIYRSLIEYAGGNAKALKYSRTDRLIASALFQLYRLNSSRRGDVLTIVGSVDESGNSG